MGITLAVGCPVKNRAWILPSWFDHVEKAFAEIDIEPLYLFVYGTSVDDTYDILRSRVEVGFIQREIEPEERAAERCWNSSRYHDMVKCRNALLGLVRAVEPTYFLSLDSDILIAPGVLPHLIETIVTKDCDAVAGKCFLSDTRFDPNYAMLFPDGSRGLIRSDSDGVFAADAIMALKLMSPAAYGTDYRHNIDGEDIGWSKACREKGLYLAWDGRITSKHVMLQDGLQRVDPRCGY